MQLELVECGLSTAFAPTLAKTLTERVEWRSAFFANGSFIDRSFRPQLCAFRNNHAVSSLDERATELLREAIDDFVARLRISDSTTRLRGQSAALALVLPEVDEDQGLSRTRLTDLGKILCNQISEAMAAELDLRIERQTIRASGHAGVGSVLTDDVAMTENAKWLLVVAVDSYSDGLRLNGLNDDGRLFSKETQFGFIPGEAAGILLLAPENGNRWSDEALAARFTLRGTGESIEPVTERQEDETLFNAMSDSALAACEMAFGKSGGRQISHWYADWNNNRYRATELSFAIHRANSFFLKEQLEPIYPALQFGDTGAAYGALALCLARSDLDGKARRTGEGEVQEASTFDVSYALISAGSTIRGLRSALVVSRSSVLP